MRDHGICWFVFAILALLPGFLCAAEVGDGQQAQLHKLRAYVAEVQAQVTVLQSALSQAEERNREQSELIDLLEKGLRARQLSDPAEQERIRELFFEYLKTHLTPSPVYRIEAHRVVIAADPVFVFSRAHLGAEGESRLHDLASVLREAVELLPDDSSWRLSVEGHTDPRPLRTNPVFPTNWELSAARATEMARFLIRQGLPEKHFLAVAWAATVPFDASSDRIAYRDDRRIELHLEFMR